MNRWRTRLCFFWEEEIAPPEEVPRIDHEPAGVPRPLRRATRFALMAVAATSLLGQVIGVRLVAPVDASPSHVSQCIQQNCTGLTGRARQACVNACQTHAP